MKIGVFGGTFDPIHWGHLVLAEEACHAAGIDRILFLPANRPPHKSDAQITPFAHRLEMLFLATGGIPEFEISELEGGDGPHYTYASLRQLAAERPSAEFLFLLGSDSLLDLPKWRHPELIVSSHRLVVFPRPGFDPSTAPAEYLERATIVGGIQIALSSTLIRQRLGAGSETHFLVPDSVRDYVRQHRLYGARP